MHEYKRQLAKYEEEKDTNDAVSSVATWRSEMVHEERMLTKYQKLLTLDDMVCPTCEGEVNEMFVNGMIKEHTERKDNCERFTQEAARKLQRLEEQNAIYRTAEREVAKLGRPLQVYRP